MGRRLRRSSVLLDSCIAEAFCLAQLSMRLDTLPALARRRGGLKREQQMVDHPA